MEETTNQMPPIENPKVSTNKDEKDTIKLVIALILVIILAFILNITNKKRSEQLDIEIMQRQEAIKANDAQIQMLQKQDKSDEITYIETDLNATNINNIGQ